MIDINIHKPLEGIKKNMSLDINLHINKNDFIALSGVSGSGKTTLLRVLAGLEDAKGTIKVNNTIWLDKTKIVPPQKRDIGFVFQDYALFENMSVEQNLLYVNNDTKLAQKLLEITHLDKIKNSMPNNLSGGQKQRVSLCRAFMNQPKLLLMDEPLSALDLNMKLKLQNEIATLHKEFDTTTIMVTHNPYQISNLANRNIVLEYGKIIKNDRVKKTEDYEKNSEFCFDAQVLSIKQNNDNYTAIVNIAQQIIAIDITKEKINSIKIGETIKVYTNSFSPTFKL